MGSGTLPDPHQAATVITATILDGPDDQTRQVLFTLVTNRAIDLASKPAAGQVASHDVASPGFPE